MPRKVKTAVPPEFVSDAEEDAGISTQTLSPRALSDNLGDAPPSPRTAPVRGFQESSDSIGDTSPPVSFTANETPLLRAHLQLAELAKLVQVLQNANASVKGRIDDTGRYDLKFSLGRERDKHRREPSPPLEPVRSSVSSASGDGSPRKQMIGWSRRRQY